MAEEPKAKTPAEETEAKTPAKKAKQQGQNNTFYLVNPAGAIHNVTREHARARLEQLGWRLATEEEIVKYQGQEVQRFDQPIARPWSPDPDEQLKLPDEE